MNRFSGDAGSILYLGLVPFGTVCQRPQQLVLQLARDVDIVYVEPHRSPVRRLLSSADAGARVTTAGLRGSLNRNQESATGSRNKRLRIFQPKEVLPFSGYLPFINQINYARTGRDLYSYLRQGCLLPVRAVILSFPKDLDVLSRFAGVPIIYDVMDDYPLFFDAWQGAVLRRLHERLLRRADMVVTSSRTLADRCGPFARRLQCITNGVDADFLEACQHSRLDAAMGKLPRPRLGYIGTISWWFDFDIVRKLAEAFPQGSIALVGPVETAVPDLPANVHLLGPRPHSEIPSLLRAFDVGLVPFRGSCLIDAVNPVKVYEYLAAGLPVASSAFAEIAAFESVISICRTSADWEAAVRRAIAPGQSQDVARRRAFAEENLWSAKAKALLTALAEIQRTRQAA